MKHSGHIKIGRLKVKQVAYQDVFTMLGKRSVENDPNGKGIRITIPSEHESLYNETFASRPVTCNLGPNVSMAQLIAEFPIEDWLLLPVNKNTLALYPIQESNKL